MISFLYTIQEHTGLEVLHSEYQFSMQTQTLEETKLHVHQAWGFWEIIGF